MTTWLVTGASRGLGRDLVEKLTARGDRVIAAARNPADLQGTKAIAVKWDATSETDSKTMAEELRSKHGIDKIDVRHGERKTSHLEKIGGRSWLPTRASEARKGV
jgi:3-oxoacyl-[acyl-carrier protein] reductase